MGRLSENLLGVYTEREVATGAHRLVPTHAPPYQKRKEPYAYINKKANRYRGLSNDIGAQVG